MRSLWQAMSAGVYRTRRSISFWSSAKQLTLELWRRPLWPVFESKHKCYSDPLVYEQVALPFGGATCSADNDFSKSF